MIHPFVCHTSFSVCLCAQLQTLSVHQVALASLWMQEGHRKPGNPIRGKTRPSFLRWNILNLNKWPNEVQSPEKTEWDRLWEKSGWVHSSFFSVETLPAAVAWGDRSSSPLQFSPVGQLSLSSRSISSPERGCIKRTVLCSVAQSHCTPPRLHPCNKKHIYSQPDIQINLKTIICFWTEWLCQGKKIIFAHEMWCIKFFYTP